MRLLLRLTLATVVLAAAAGRASAATTAAQLIELSRAGLSDDILIALIQTDGSVFALTAQDILALHRAGLSDRVILAMQATARKRVPLPAPADDQTPPAPERVERIERVERVEVVQPPPVVNVTQTVTQRVEPPAAYGYTPYGLPIGLPVYLPPRVTPRPEPPVYWGWGGKRRPDSWDDTPAPPPDPKAPDTRKKN